MLSKISHRILRNNILLANNFGSSKEVHLDKNATWLKFRTSRKLQAFDGIIDTHVPIPPPANDDPFTHLK